MGLRFSRDELNTKNPPKPESNQVEPIELVSASPTSMASTPASSFQKTVCLQSWWLIKAEENNQGRKLAVAGYPSLEQRVPRLFSSAPIVKRHDVFSLETEDGVCVVIQGFIDKDRTKANGFPTEVCQHFLFGFPSYWEECAKKFLGEESIAEGLAGNSPGNTEAAVSNVDGGSEILNTYPGNTYVEPLTPSNLKRNDITPSTSDVNVIITPSNSKIGENYAVKKFTAHKIVNPISPCRLSKITEPNSMPMVRQKPNHVRAMNRLVKELQSDFNTALPDEISSHCSGRVLRSSRKLKGVKKDDQVSARVLEKEKGVSVSVFISMDGSHQEENGVGNTANETGNLDLSDAGSQCLVNETTPRNQDSIPPKDDFEFFSKGEKSKHDQNHEEVMNESSIQTGMRRAASASKNSTSVKHKLKTSIGRNESFSKTPRASERMAKRKLAYEIPVSDEGDEQVPATTPESMTFKRSRSGRALLRTLDYWRNERAVYDKDRRITGIKTNLDPEHPYKGSRSEPPRKRVSLKR